MQNYLDTSSDSSNEEAYFTSENSQKAPAIKSNLTREEFEEMKGLFDMFDFDQSGDISVDEIQKIMRLAGKNMTKEEIKTMITDDDGDHNNQIDMDEFCTLMKKEINPTSRFDELEKVFY